MRDVVGKCPHCEYAGNVGEACRERVCSRKGYHFIPINHFEDLKDRPFHARDQHIGLVMGDYLIVGEVGKGGFGKVYLALQLPVLMKAALKLMVRGSSDPVTAATLLKKFEGEALSLARLNHPNIVRLLKYGTFVDTPYIVMEYVEGGRTLKQEVTERVFIGDGFETATAKHIVGQILNALESAHAQKIIHRDIKPENIMLQHVAGDKYFVRILDFGLSKFVEDRTQTSMVVGTPTYMAPEQITGKNIGPWTDIYAIGVIAYEMITGRRPFAGKSRQEIFSRKLDPLYNPVERILDVGYPEVVLRFFERAVAREADDRYSNVHEFRDGVERVFRALEKTQHVSISSSDLAQL
ncbi:MAG: serine/threonine protein kinase, partial [Myxococcales bacterium]|nr:serine/threonine protein kinase [Myxococcales bacterium]